MDAVDRLLIWTCSYRGMLSQDKYEYQEKIIKSILKCASLHVNVSSK